MSFVSGNTLRRWTSRLLARDSVFRVVQKGLHSTLDARRAVDRNAERVFSVLDIPTRRDIERLETDIADLDETLSRLQQRVIRLKATIDAQGRRAGEHQPPH